MKYTVYQVTNIINQKIYIGKHQTNDVNDRYFGSGVALCNAIKKYSKENFTKEILFIFDTEEEMNQKERELITEDFVKRKDTYNLGVGGEGGPHFKGKQHAPETIEKIRNARSTQLFTVVTRRKMSESNKNRTVSRETRVKCSIKAHMRNGKTLEEATKKANNNVDIIDNARRTTKVKQTTESRSAKMKQFYKDPEKRLQKADQTRRLHKEYDLVKIKKDYTSGLKPKDIMKKYNLTKNRYDHIRTYYLK